MLSHPPRLSYVGLTVIMSNPSRFDTKSLLSANGGGYFSECLSPDFNRFQIDIRLKEDTRPLLPNTKCLLLLGESSAQLRTGLGTSLNALRGNVCRDKETGIYAIASYNAQECLDQRNYESEFNPLLNQTDSAVSFDGQAGDNSAVDEKKRGGKTSAKNYRFWFSKDMEKAKLICCNGGVLPHRYSIPFNYIIYPSLLDVCSILEGTKNGHLYFDIETDTRLNITVFSFSFGHPNIYVVPIISHDYTHAYTGLHRIFKALAVALRDNIVVAHNGSGFDFIVLPYKYKIPIGKRSYDTMLAQNRIYPEAEKSLGHCISLPWMFEPYHKDEGSFAYGNQAQAMQLWKYCGKDVSSLILLKEAQDEYAKHHVGIRSSIDSVNSYIRSYVTITLTGMRFNKTELEDTVKINDRLCNAYLRILDVLIGKRTLALIKKGGKGSIATSSKQAVRYFHGMLKYKVVMKSKITGEPSLAAKAMYRLKLIHNNPVIDIIIAYRSLAKESGSLGFRPLKG